MSRSLGGKKLARVDMKYFIAAPFGNYLKFKNAISVKGTFTVNPRPGRFKQILKTLLFLEYLNLKQ